VTAKELLRQKVGPYYIESILGSGGMAVVYRARTPQDEVVALKVLFPPPGTGKEILTRFEREARTAARLNHPAIIRVFDVGQAEGRAFMAMTLVEGQNLTTRLAQVGRFDEATAADIAWQIADALYYAHRQGVVHRDVKSSNILLTDEGRALLTDFGVAQALDDPALTRTGHTVGTPAYMAPEQATGNQAVDGRADLYSLGVVLYQMVTGRVPFEGSTPQVLHAHVYQPPPAPSTIAEVSPGMEAIILRALAKDVSKRFQTGAAMAQALAQLDDQTKIQLHTTPTFTRLEKVSILWPPQRISSALGRYLNRQLGLWTVLLTLLIVTGAIVIWSPWRSTPTTESVDMLAASSTTPPPTSTRTVQPSPTPSSPTAPPLALPFPVGSLLKGSGDGIFRLRANGTLQHIYDWPTFLAFGFAETDIQTVDETTLAKLPEGGELTRLLQGPDQSLYWVATGERWYIQRWQSVLENGYLGLPPSPADERLLEALPLTVEGEDLPEGALIKVGDNFYRLFANGVLRRFATSELFTASELVAAYGYTSEDFIEIPDEVSHLYQSGPPLTPLLQAEGSEAVFLITEGKRRPMPPIGDELWALGYGNEDISQVPAEFLEDFTLKETEVSLAPSSTPSSEPIATLPPSPTSVPQPTATVCPQSIDEALVILLDTSLDEPLDCPRTPAVTTPAAWQPFENGLMLWRADLNLIYVIEGNNWLPPVGDRWREGDEPYDPSIIAPSGYYQPGRGFGLVWREQPGVRAALGWGLAEESGFTTTIQEFTRGLVWYDAERGRLMILYNSGAYQLVEGIEAVDSSQPAEKGE
jgi:serine/threonine protein kinase